MGGITIGGASIPVNLQTEMNKVASDIAANGANSPAVIAEVAKLKPDVTAELNDPSLTPAAKQTLTGYLNQLGNINEIPAATQQLQTTLSELDANAEIALDSFVCVAQLLVKLMISNINVNAQQAEQFQEYDANLGKEALQEGQEQEATSTQSANDELTASILQAAFTMAGGIIGVVGGAKSMKEHVEGYREEKNINKDLDINSDKRKVVDDALTDAEKAKFTKKHVLNDAKKTVDDNEKTIKSLRKNVKEKLEKANKEEADVEADDTLTPTQRENKIKKIRDDFTNETMADADKAATLEKTNKDLNKDIKDKLTPEFDDAQKNEDSARLAKKTVDSDTKSHDRELEKEKRSVEHRMKLASDIATILQGISQIVPQVGNVIAATFTQKDKIEAAEAQMDGSVTAYINSMETWANSVITTLTGNISTLRELIGQLYSSEIQTEQNFTKMA
jgi:hypothetical protein